MKFSKYVRQIGASFVALSLLVGAHPARAITVLDPTNLVQNLKSANESVKQVRQAIEQTAKQVEMVNNLKNNIRGLSVEGLVTSFAPEMARQLKNLKDADKDYKELARSLGDLGQRFETKIAAANTKGLSLQAFFDLQLTEKRNGSKAAAKIIDRDMEAIRGTQDVIKQAQKWRDKIGSLNDNLGGSMQLLNTQLNQVASTNAEMLAYAAQASTVTQNKAAEESANQAAAQALVVDEIKSEKDAMTQANKGALDGFKKKGYDPFKPSAK